MSPGEADAAVVRRHLFAVDAASDAFERRA